MSGGIAQQVNAWLSNGSNGLLRLENGVTHLVLRDKVRSHVVAVNRKYGAVGERINSALRRADHFALHFS